ncbi:MAG: hypothetical protein JNL88_12955 [Bacteroidia bacterium]|nr:hypothetical protein [Bacteroidia bacterium]
MTYKYLSFSLAITFISFMVGMILNAFLRKTAFYHTHLSYLNFVKSEKLNHWMGVGMVKWVVKNTPFKYFNQTLKLRPKTDKVGLHALRKEMTKSELDHLTGFAFVSLFALVKFYNSEFLFGLTMMTVNVLMNLHPSLLQQQNKRRIDRLMNKL